MKFHSKNINLRIILKPGLPAEPLTGRAAQPGLHVKFENGVVTVNDPNTAKLMKQHPGFGRDFVDVDEAGVDPYAAQRATSMEPEHDQIEIKHGGIGKNLNPKPRMRMTADQKRALAQMAMEMAMEMAPKMAKEMLDKMVAVEQESAKGSAPQAEPSAEPSSGIAIPESPDLPEADADQPQTETLKPRSFKTEDTAEVISDVKEEEVQAEEVEGADYLQQGEGLKQEDYPVDAPEEPAEEAKEETKPAPKEKPKTTSKKAGASEKGKGKAAKNTK